MTCTTCGGLMREDVAFTRDMESINDPRRMYRCQNGHPAIEPPGAIPVWKPDPLPEGVTKSGWGWHSDRPCDICGKVLGAIRSGGQRRHAGVCNAAYDRERAKERYWRDRKAVSA